MSSCMICETPYGILNCINYAYHQHSEESFDLYVGDNFRNSRTLAEHLRESGLFENVWMFRKVPENPPFVQRMNRKYFPGKYIEYVVGDPSFRLKDYDRIYLTAATRIPSCMILACRSAEVYFMEDGLRSYVDDIYVEPLSKAEKLLHAVAGRRCGRVIPKVVYLNNARLCEGHTSYEVRQLPKFAREDKKFCELLFQAFGDTASGQYVGKKIVYLAQPLEYDLKLEGLSGIEQSVEGVLASFGDCLLYRPHPRQGLTKKEGFCLDTEGRMWELVCMEEISDETILVGSFSTALFTPKLLYDKEPWMIFTYPLYQKCMGSREKKLLDGIETMIGYLRRTCRNPKKVICVKNLEELEKIIGKVIKEDR